MNLEVLTLTLDVAGKILIALTALMVHHRVKNEQRIDKKVLNEMKMEQSAGILGVILIIAAYILHIYIL